MQPIFHGKIINPRIILQMSRSTPNASKAVQKKPSQHVFYRLLNHSATPRVLNPIKHIFGDPGAKLSPKNIALSRLVAPGSPRMDKTLLLVF